MAPEIIEMSGHCTKSDIWSVGCVAIELLTGKPPFWEEEQIRALFAIVSNDRPPFPNNIDEEITDFLMKCFVKDIDTRSTAEDLLSHSFLNKHRAPRELKKRQSFKDISTRLEQWKNKENATTPIKENQTQIRNMEEYNHQSPLIPKEDETCGCCLL
eukprot:TRINITY_DN979_c0_g3_i2.p1 TRINITY_DN979_c0_g3~~TRINITY_DN979_c0_g3_i2.p1  ORF type:complete len:157 (-),score=42.24 TRINITY_DN979_c0_g3_i2:72-542(-)